MGENIVPYVTYAVTVFISIMFYVIARLLNKRFRPSHPFIPTLPGTVIIIIPVVNIVISMMYFCMVLGDDEF